MFFFTSQSDTKWIKRGGWGVKLTAFGDKAN